MEFESAKQRTSPGKPKPDEDDNLKQVDLIPGTFKNYTLSTLHARGTRVADQALNPTPRLYASIMSFKMARDEGNFTFTVGKLGT